MTPPPRDKKQAKTARGERLAAALRENLRRRKAQARERAADPPKASPEPGGGKER